MTGVLRGGIGLLVVPAVLVTPRAHLLGQPGSVYRTGVSYRQHRPSHGRRGQEQEE